MSAQPFEFPGLELLIRREILLHYLVGEKTATKLLTEFKSIEKIKNLTLDELVSRTNLKIGQAIYTYFKDKVDEVGKK